jgi:succinate dehydrogenase/fumarate reductase cytochrome b subunit
MLNHAMTAAIEMVVVVEIAMQRFLPSSETFPETITTVSVVVVVAVVVAVATALATAVATAVAVGVKIIMVELPLTVENGSTRVNSFHKNCK